MGTIIGNALSGKIQTKAKQYITASDIENNGVFKAALNAAKKYEIDRCENFMTNVATSAFAANKQGLSNCTSYIGSIIGSAKNVINNVNATSDLVTSTINIVKNMIVGAVETTVAGVSNITGTYLERITMLPVNMTSYIAKRTAYWTTYTLADSCNASFVTTQLALTDEIQQKTDSLSRKTEKITRIGSKVSDVTNKVNNRIKSLTDTLTTYIAYTTSYIDEGPEWVRDNIIKHINNGLSIYDTFISDEYSKLENYCSRIADTAAKDTGEYVARQTKDLITQKLHKAQNKIANEVAKVENKVKTTSILTIAVSKLLHI